MPPKRILVIDDEQGVRDAFAMSLSDAAYAVETAKDGALGLEKALQFQPDLVFLDLKMPGMDGVATLRRLQRQHPDLPVYIVTSYHQEFMDPLKLAMAEGLTFEIVRKPLDWDEIQNLAEAVFQGDSWRPVDSDS